jgi:hypothetical protein
LAIAGVERENKTTMLNGFVARSVLCVSKRFFEVDLPDFDKRYSACTILKSTTAHTHEENYAVKERGIAPKVKQMIEQYELIQITPAGMLLLIADADYEPPHISQVYRLLKEVRKGKVESGSYHWSLQDKKEFAEKRQLITEDEDEVFVALLDIFNFKILLFNLSLILNFSE